MNELFPNFTQPQPQPVQPSLLFPGKKCRHCEHCGRARDEYIAHGIRYVCIIKPAKNKWKMKYIKLKNPACEFYQDEIKDRKPQRTLVK
jgi:hypothetical protein